MSASAIDRYLSCLAAELRKQGVFAARFMEETRGHLTDAAAAAQQRGLALDAAQQEAVRRFGDPKTVARRFAAEKNRTLHWILLAAAVLLGLAIAWLDSRPHWDDAGITAGLLLLSAGLLGLVGPRRPWLWALATGVWLPAWMPVHIFVQTHRIVLDPLLACVSLALSMAGAYAGMALRRMIVAAAA